MNLSPIRYELRKSFPIRMVPGIQEYVYPHTFYYFRIGDVNDDGRHEILISRGAIHQAAYSLDGELLWEYVDPRANTGMIRPDSQTVAIDVDGDGHTEMTAARMLGPNLHLCVLDGKTGQIKHSVPYPGWNSAGNNRSAIGVFKSKKGMSGYDLAVCWDYFFLGALDCNLKALWEWRVPGNQLGFGHTLAIADVDRDGADELVWGASLFGAQGELRWSRADLIVQAKDNHNDCSRIGDVDADGRPEIFFSTGGYLLNADGTVRWSLLERFRKNEFDHGQFVRLAKLTPGCVGLDIVFIDLPTYAGATSNSETFYAANVVLFDAVGRERGRFRSIHDVRIGDMDGDGANEIAALSPDGQTLRFLGGGLEERGSMPFPGRAYKPIDRHISDARLFDVDRDGCCEFMQVRREGDAAWFEIYGNTAAPTPSRTRLSAPLNTQELANFTAY